MTVGKTGAPVVQINESSNDRVLLTTQDSDRFIRTQREVVSAMRGAEDLISRGQKLADDMRGMISDIQAWCNQHQNVREFVVCPRLDDLLAVVVAKDEDERGELDDAISKIDLEMFARNKFRVTWLMLRASEAGGIGSFINSSEAKTIYRAR